MQLLNILSINLPNKELPEQEAESRQIGHGEY
jgi:hypothetical protein